VANKNGNYSFLKPPFSINTIALQQFCNGENHALSTLYNAWLPELYLVAYRYVQAQQEAEDVVADCFEKVFAMSPKKRHQKFIKEEINIKALLLVMVKNKSLDVIKSKNTRNRILDGIKKFLPTEVFNGVKQTLTDDNFKSLLTCLPEKEKQIIILSIEGFSNKEIASQLNLSEKTIANMLSIARKKVKHLWEMFME
jgi:RNA polymerase sigma-70 factor (ECF subfamily)